MPKRKLDDSTEELPLDDSTEELPQEIELKLAYMNVGQTIDMWTEVQADNHQQKFARTVETVMVGSEIDILWLCEVGSDFRGLSESELTPKQALQRRKKLNDIANIIDNLGPYLILVRKKIGIELVDLIAPHTFPVSQDRVQQCIALSRFQIGQSTLVGAVAHVLEDNQERHNRQERVRLRRAFVDRIVKCIKDKSWDKKATVVLGGNFNFYGDELEQVMQMHQPPDGLTAPDEVWRVFRTVMELKGDCFAYKGASRVKTMEISMGLSYKDAGRHGCLQSHDVVAAKVTLTSFVSERTGVVAQHTDQSCCSTCR